MISLLLSLALSENINDLAPPFQEDLHGNIGTWSFAGSFVILKDIIMLTPPVQHKFGCAWTRADIPETDWSANFNFRVHKGTGGGGLGIWLVENYGSYGELHGGPATYKGLLVSITIRDNDDEMNTHSLIFHVIENNGADKINVTLIESDFEMQFHHRYDIPFRMEISDGKIRLYCSGENESNPPLLLEKAINISLKQKYLGITAASEEMTSRVDLNYVKFTQGVEKTVKKETDYLQRIVVNGYTSKPNTIYRNPVFKIMTKETEAMRRSTEKNRENTFENVVDIIDELNKVTFDVASFKELNTFVTDTLYPYSQKWHRRTIKMTENIRIARNVMASATNYTSELLQNFNSTLKHTIFKTAVTISQLEQELLKSASEQPKADDNTTVIVLDLSKDSLSTENIISYLLMLEIICVIIYVFVRYTKSKQ